MPFRRSLRHSLADQHGQDTIEYVGALAIVAALIAVVVLAVQTLGPLIARDAECLVAKVFGIGGCSSSSSTAYPVSASIKTVGYSGRFTVIDGGHSYAITLTKYSNGTSKITAIDTGKLGVSAQWGADAELGPLGSAGVDASASGGGYGDQSSTWTFPTWSAGQQAFDHISQGSSLGLTAHDAVAGTVGQVPVAGPWATGLFDSITGASGAPDQGSLPHKYLTSTSTGGGLQGSADGGAHVDLGPFQGGVSASLDGHAGVEHIDSGPQKGDWQFVAGLDGTADGDLADILFGPQAEGLGNVNGEVRVTYGSNGSPQTLEVTASGDGVWDVGPANGARADVPGSSSSEGGSTKEGGSSGESGKGPVLSIESSSPGGNGVGTTFTGELDLSNDPQAAQDVQLILAGDTSSLPDLIDQLNSQGTETLQSYTIERSGSTVGGSVSVGAGVGAQLNDGTAHITYNRPKTREDGGQWHYGP